MSSNRHSLHPVGYFISWRTYGTWLQGDERGWTERGVGQHGHDPVILARCRERMRFPALQLTPLQRHIVESAVRETCSHRGWTLHALRVQREHVHVVVAAPASAEKVLGDLKAWATRHLRNNAPELCERDVWSRDGNKQHLRSESDVRGAVDYVCDEHHDDRPR